MIYTVTFNPALDYIVRMEEFRLGLVNRTNFEDVYIGGKGKMCIRDRHHTLMLNPQVAGAPQYLLDKHYFRKHGANAYYGQTGI